MMVMDGDDGDDGDDDDDGDGDSDGDESSRLLDLGIFGQMSLKFPKIP